ncbi:hypothetical protein ODJ79_32835 [Actinoplanes sp. KI2]|uniref:hypothetical protein n=1 Tax=Actinoplanes sp. KI2 TaxID=2983315 RepID=UPI0021D61490|nr:hypothetical protein [Actinoplanes sp. KI2]MCU7728523.1 hypothetical protein [Actinoplanes sp. KI2]
MSREWREGIIGGSALLTLLSGFLPWWAMRVGTETFVGSAWRMSSRWTVAILLTVGAAVGWLAWRMTRGRVPVAIWLAALAAVAVSVLLTLQQRSDVETWPPAEVNAAGVSEVHLSSVKEVSATEFAESLMPRDRLRRYSDPGIEAGTSYGFWVGLVGMTLTGLSLVVAGRGGRNPR